MRKKFYDYVDDIPVWMYGRDVLDICHQGDNGEDVDNVLCQQEVAAQFDIYNTETLRNAVNEVIADDDDCKGWSKARLVSYMIWIAAWNIYDDCENDWHKDYLLNTDAA